ncbi:MAG: hypothetical protein HY423_00185 [Candidatus Lambdaproteobacteria bacterium]|nr:hypothetical protein [Candidatus Lambdaproteobacteria bacterium]
MKTVAVRPLQQALRALALAAALSVLSWPWCHGGASLAHAHGAAAPRATALAQAAGVANGAPGAGSAALGCCEGVQSLLQADIGPGQPAKQFPGPQRTQALPAPAPPARLRATVPLAGLAPHRASLYRQAVLIRI